MNVQPFSLGVGNTLSLTATTSGASVTLNASGAASQCIRIYNAGTVAAYLRASLGASTPSTSTDLPIPPGGVEVFSKGDCDTISAITATGSAALYITPGEGQ